MSHRDTDMQILEVNRKSLKVIMFRKACYFMKLDYGMNCRYFVMTMTKKAQKRHRFNPESYEQDTAVARLGFGARPGFKPSSVTYWICDLGRLNEKGP